MEKNKNQLLYTLRCGEILGKLDGKTVAIIAAQEFEDIELLYPLLRLSEEGAKIIIVPVKSGLHPRPVAKKPVSGRYGTPIPLEVMREGKRYVCSDLEDVAVEKIDCLLFPGGFSPDALRLEEKVLEMVKTMNSLDKIIAAICHGPQVLISAELVRGRRITSYAAVRDDLINAGAVFVDESAVRDRNIITARVPDDLPEFCQTIIEALSDT